MSIEDLGYFADRIKDDWQLNCVTHKIIDILKHQSDQIADLRKELAQKEVLKGHKYKTTLKYAYTKVTL